MNYASLVKAINSVTAQLQGRAAAAVNQALVLRNWLVGAYLVEFEQHTGQRVAGDATRREDCGNGALQRCRVLRADDEHASVDLSPAPGAL